VRPGRKQLVGLTSRDKGTLLDEGAQVVGIAHAAPGTPALGHVTSSYWSAALGRCIALALVADGRRRIGERLYVPMPSGDIEVDVVSPVFFDPKGERLNG
jgi:sarcosine oxidase subunit alpha